MSPERRQYRRMRLAALGSGSSLWLMVCFFSIQLSHWAWSWWAVRHEACSCGVLLNNQSGWWWAAIGVLAAITGWSAFLTHKLVRYWRHTAQWHKEFLVAGDRLVWNHYLQQPISVVTNDRPLAITHGWRRPRIFVTTGLIRILTRSEFNAVLAHEAAHCRQRDPLFMAWLEFCVWAWPFLPWFRQWRTDGYRLRELAADAVATDDYLRSGQLAAAILKLTAPMPLSLTAFSPNTDRVEKLIDHHWRPQINLWPKRFWWPVVVLVVGLIWIGQTSRTMATQDRWLSGQTCREIRFYCQQLPPPIRFSSGLPWLAHDVITPR